MGRRDAFCPFRFLEAKMKAVKQNESGEELQPRTGRSSVDESDLKMAGGSEPIAIERSQLRSSPVTRRATGPRTPAGKERSKRNALKHGIFSNVVLLEAEQRAEFGALLRGLRKDFQPKRTVEQLLVDKLACLYWRLRCLYSIAEIHKDLLFTRRDGDHQPSQAVRISIAPLLSVGNGWIQQIEDPEVRERCLELLRELKEGILRGGFDRDRDLGILNKVYGKWKCTLLDRYQVWSSAANSSEEKRQQNGSASPQQCIRSFLKELEEEITRLEHYTPKKPERIRNVADSPEPDLLIRYEASLERNIDRTLSQLERLQRMRRGQAVPPPIEVNVSST